MNCRYYIPLSILKIYEYIIHLFRKVYILQTLKDIACSIGCHVGVQLVLEGDSTLFIHYTNTPLIVNHK